jgi:hypothetical protein
MAARAGGDHRGSAASRRIRKLWMLATWGNGSECPCIFCETPLTFATVEADRIIPGASYARVNVQPACRTCNLAKSDDAEWSYGS